MREITSGGPPWLVEHLTSLDAAFSLPGGGIGGGRSLMTSIREAPTAVRIATPLDPLTPLWQLSQLPAPPNLDTVPDQMPFATQAVMMGGNVRVGLEDSLYIGRGQLAKSNAEQVAKIRRMIEELGYQIATPKEAREILQLKGQDRTKF